MGSLDVQCYLERAQDFLESMQLLRDDKAYRNSSALLAIHSAVSYTDALRVGLGDVALGAEDHRNAAKALKQLLSTKTQATNNGLRHFEFLIARKTAVAYSSRRLAIEDFESLFTHAERFAKWANQIGNELKIEGWTYGN